MFLYSKIVSLRKVSPPESKYGAIKEEKEIENIAQVEPKRELFLAILFCGISIWFGELEKKILYDKIFVLFPFSIEFTAFITKVMGLS
mmetsp:Transcript_9485/g.13125  ORF Transcript_9485/g.13125 Transcript_9485/m.13125 type:complete len:88 (+) Transcript_9485:1-264(+)